MFSKALKMKKSIDAGGKKARSVQARRPNGSLSLCRARASRGKEAKRRSLLMRYVNHDIEPILGGRS